MKCTHRVVVSIRQAEFDIIEYMVRAVYRDNFYPYEPGPVSICPGNLFVEYSRFARIRATCSDMALRT